MKRIIAFLLLFFLIYFPVIFADTTQTLTPQSDGGSDSASWKNAAGVACNSTDCYLEVDEAVGSACSSGSDGDTSYVESNTLNASQTFALNEEVIPGGATINEIRITVCSKKIQTGAPDQIQTQYCLNGACHSSGVNIGSGAGYSENAQNYSDINVPRSGGNDLEIGVIVTSYQNNPVRVSRISAVVLYTPLQSVPIEPPRASIPIPERYRFAPSRVELKGVAYPGSRVEILQKVKYATEYRPVADSAITILHDGTFSVLAGNLAEGDYFFSLQAQDRDGARGNALLLPITLHGYDDFIKEDILMSPTLELEKSALNISDFLKIKGYGFGYGKMELEIDGKFVQEGEADSYGFYALSFPVKSLESGTHYLKIRSRLRTGLASIFSNPVAFKVFELAFPETDFNQDNKVDISDWSIFLFRWSSQDPGLKQKIDIDKNGKIDIVDFSIFLKAMTI